jgi:hypothetical protein
MTGPSALVRYALLSALLLLARPALGQPDPVAVVSIRGWVRAVQFSQPPRGDVWLYATSDVMQLRPGECVRVAYAGGEATVRLRLGVVTRLRSGQQYCIPVPANRTPSPIERARSAFSGTFRTVLALLSGPPPPSWAGPLESRGDSTRVQPYPILLLPDTLVWASMNARPTLAWLPPEVPGSPLFELAVFPADERCARAGEAVARGRSVDRRFTPARALARGASFRVELARPGGPVLEHGCLRVARAEEAQAGEEGVRAMRDHFAKEGGADPAEDVFVAARLVDGGLQVDAISLLLASSGRDARGGGARALLALLTRYAEHLEPPAAGGR